MIEITPEYLASQDLSPTIVQRFWKHVQKTESCWLWTAAIDRKWYGAINTGIRNESGNCILARAHRVSWIIHIGPIPDGLCVLHDCPGGDNALCVNPDHLWLGTVQENNADMDSKGRRRACPPKGRESPNAKLTEEQVIEIRQRYVKHSHKNGSVQIAKEFGVDHTAIIRVITRQTWNHI